jgi:predicted nucleotidyltransferase
MTDHNLNILRIRSIDTLLEELSREVVYVGGATVSLYADRMSYDFRPTMDVDILVEVGSTKEYLLIQEKLRDKGFQPDRNAAFVGRFLIQGLIIDLMSTDQTSLGFNNRWYADGFRNAVWVKIDEEHTVRIFTAPHFIASKLEAFNNRGKGDGRTSTDFEDIIYVLEHRQKIWEEMAAAEPELKTYLVNKFQDLIRLNHLEEWIEGHVGFKSTSATHYLIDQWQKFANEEFN